MRSPISAARRNGPLRLTRDDLVEQVLADLDERRVQRRHAGVVDEHVDAAELVVHGVGRARRGRPSARRGRRRASARATGLGADLARRLPRRRRACGWRSTTSAPRRAKASTISRPRPRLPPVTSADLAGQVDVHQRLPDPPEDASGTAGEHADGSPRLAMRSSVLSPRT